ncbi:related to 17-beta-hydroxysteroid dehydrogenase [Melanopsichium pennsylvanicum]|uniref:Very-long-chain 3-oxoacyl-CoA reductase n=2 Tax=Melanopsichium pennsylvanicum TaxID=63383 RepID=A0AAJ4XLH1_9BASI|nr:related to 17-beta-hydroxysteroid dehydrogenase [Melanopsichium pennsylvanicum 4]SNX84042.1 related to 17-beta-hydroxysteroid dehydrogenase [Melanopsichium pennsylvanicum]
MTIEQQLDGILRHVGLRVDHGLTPLSAALVVFAGIGALATGTFFIRLAHLFADCYILPGKPLSKFGANKKDFSKATWAIITGATDGIGREFSLQLARKGFNILLVSRSPEKLGAVAAEIEAASPGVRTKTQAIDFALGDEKQYEGLEHTVKDLNIGVLVNNVGKSHNMPVAFAETTEEEMEDIIEINVVSILRVSRMVIPGMVQRKKGLVLNLGSFAGQVTTPLLATYAGSKAFLAGWSQALGEELKRSNITVSLLNTYFVVSNMSKVRKSSSMIPTPKQYVGQVLKTIGNNGGAVARPYTSTPWPMHALVDWATTYILPRGWLLSYTYDQQVGIRKRAIRKAEKAVKST